MQPTFGEKYPYLVRSFRTQFVVNFAYTGRYFEQRILVVRQCSQIARLQAKVRFGILPGETQARLSISDRKLAPYSAAADSGSFSYSASIIALSACWFMTNVAACQTNVGAPSWPKYFR